MDMPFTTIGEDDSLSDYHNKSDLQPKVNRFNGNKVSLPTQKSFACLLYEDGNRTQAPNGPLSAVRSTPEKSKENLFMIDVLRGQRPLVCACLNGQHSSDARETAKNLLQGGIGSEE